MGFRTAFSQSWSPLGAALLFLLPAGSLPAQESIRPSLAGAFEAATRKPTIDTSSYNLKLGPVVFNLSDSLDVEFTDNVGLSETNRKADLILEPFVNARAFWQFSQLNALSFNLGIGYIKYLKNSQFDMIDVAASPDSNLALDIYVGDFRFTLFDRFSIQQDPVQNINLSNVANYPRAENALGLSVVWDLNQLMVFGGYSHYTFYSLDSQFASQNNAEEQFFFSAGLKLNPALTMGIRGTFASVHYTQNIQPDSLNTSLGPYIEARLTPYINLTAEAGYQGASFSAGALNNDGSQLNTYYARIELSHRLNRYWTETLGAGRESQLGLNTNFTEITYFNYSAIWRVNSRLTLNLNAYYQDGVDSSGSSQAEKIHFLGCGLSFERKLGRLISFHAGYDFVNRASDLPDRSYYQNRFLFGLNYAF